MLLHQLPQCWGVPGHGLRGSRAPDQTYRLDRPQVRVLDFLGDDGCSGPEPRPPSPPADIDTPPLSAYVPTQELRCLLVADYEQTLQGAGSWLLLGEAWLWESGL